MLEDIYSSGTPALRRLTKYVTSTKARIFGTPQDLTARKTDGAGVAIVTYQAAHFSRVRVSESVQVFGRRR